MQVFGATETTELTEKPTAGLKVSLLVELACGYSMPPICYSSRPD